LNPSRESFTIELAKGWDVSPNNGVAIIRSLRIFAFAKASSEVSQTFTSITQSIVKELSEDEATE
jgi:hypothetical protein